MGMMTLPVPLGYSEGQRKQSESTQDPWTPKAVLLCRFYCDFQISVIPMVLPGDRKERSGRLLQVMGLKPRRAMPELCKSAKDMVETAAIAAHQPSLHSLSTSLDTGYSPLPADARQSLTIGFFSVVEVARPKLS